MMYLQGLDGTAHVTYFDKETQLSFVWDGHFDRLVQVSEGGYGEPVVETFVMSGHPQYITADHFLRYFEFECRKFVANWKAQGKGKYRVEV